MKIPMLIMVSFSQLFVRTWWCVGIVIQLYQELCYFTDLVVIITWRLFQYRTKCLIATSYFHGKK